MGLFGKIFGAVVKPIASVAGKVVGAVTGGSSSSSGNAAVNVSGSASRTSNENIEAVKQKAAAIIAAKILNK